jgi:hypothetical protein
VLSPSKAPDGETRYDEGETAMSMSMILAREARTLSPRTTSQPTPVAPARTRTRSLARWAGPAIVILALLLAAIMPLALPALTSPQSERVVVVDRNPDAPGGAADH